jgi:metal-responsive CopG/Arc/MetJ family transcriptional regulator
MKFNLDIKVFNETDNKMKTQGSRISTKLTHEMRARIENLISEGKFQNLSQFLRKAIEHYLALQ